MGNTRKKSTNQTIKNKTNKCMETFVEKKVKYWIKSVDKEIKKLDHKNLTKEEQKTLNKLKKQRKTQINSLKKQYKLYNCNINCKNTLLEPGDPSQLPKSMRKEFHNNKQLIKIFTKKRKDLFHNKRNVLIDNFYEKMPEVNKKKLIKEGAISDCIPYFE
jgi:small-conductance mechanosensitive channel